MKYVWTYCMTGYLCILLDEWTPCPQRTFVGLPTPQKKQSKYLLMRKTSPLSRQPILLNSCLCILFEQVVAWFIISANSCFHALRSHFKRAIFVIRRAKCKNGPLKS